MKQDSSLLDFISHSQAKDFDKPLAFASVRELQTNKTIGTAQLLTKLNELQGQPFDAVGYVPLTLAYVYLSRPDRDIQVDLSDLCLQGPAHEAATPIPHDLQAKLQAELVQAMTKNFAQLAARLAEIPASAKSCYQGDDSYWRAARQWAQSLAIQSNLEEKLPQGSSWRFEDILDVSITGATTTLLKNHEAELETLNTQSAAPHAEVVADIWDGINDGAWDQVMNAHTHLDAFVVPASQKPLVLNLQHSKLERARFGKVDLAGWNIANAEVLLADLRSAKNITKANWENTSWWAALLPPATRYELSRQEKDDAFKAWGASPPWQNPYYTQPWPVPLG